MTDSAKTKIIAALFALACAVGVCFFGAFVFMKTWNWFLPPVTGWTAISYWQAYGILTVVDVICLGVKSYTDEDSDDADFSEQMVKNIAYAVVKIIVYAILLGIGALVSLGV